MLMAAQAAEGMTFRRRSSCDASAVFFCGLGEARILSIALIFGYSSFVLTSIYQP
jgi:hypothetical protein